MVARKRKKSIKEPKKKSEWLRIDEREDVIASLEQCCFGLEMVSSRPAAWKWVILSLHNALQGAMVCHLSGTAQLGALASRASQAWMEWHERDRKGQIRRIHKGTDEFGLPILAFATKADHPPSDKLARTFELFERLSNVKVRTELGAGGILMISEDEKRSFNLLNEVRNNFTHFTPSGWSLELAGLPRVCRDIISIIERISQDDWPFRHLSQARRRKIAGLLVRCKKRLLKLEP